MSKIPNLMKKIKDGFLSVLFPLFCADCGAEGSWCCNDCLEKITRNAVLFCPGCGKDSYAGRTCDKCRNTLPLEGLIAAASYADPGVRKLIKALKFDSATDVLPVLKRLSVHARGVVVATIPDALIVPMPLYKTRERMRGYNQSELLAKELFPGQKIVKALLRIKNTRPQAKLQNESRFINIKGAFEAERKFNGETIILVDDVYTTGATMNEAARILKDAGAGDIWGFVIARG